MRRPFLPVGIVFIISAFVGLFFAFIYPGPEPYGTQGIILIVSIAVAFLFLGVWACLKKEKIKQKEKIKPVEYIIRYPASRGFVGQPFQRSFAESTHEVFKALNDEEAKEIFKAKCKEKNYSAEHSKLFKRIN